MIAAIEEREREERIRQGYLPAPGSGEDGQPVGQIAGPSTARHSGLRFGQGAEQRSGNAQARVNTAPSFVRGPQGAERGKSPKQQGVVQTVGEARGALGAEGQGSSSEASSSSQTRPQSPSAPYPVPTPETPGVAPPSRTVDPSAHSSPEELRRLSEEDTKRRIRESERKTPPAQAEPVGSASDGVQGVTGGSGFKPRRRGA
jgi:NADH dehydrogenase [ubiquinone] 1 alpha subcomplex assembly factor 2